MKINIKGFTLIELLLAVAVVSILSGVGYFTWFSKVQERTRDAQRVVDVDSIKVAVEAFYEKNNKYPPLGAAYQPYQEENFTSDTIPPGATGWIPELVPAFTKTLPKDPKQAMLRLYFALKNFLNNNLKILLSPQDVLAAPTVSTVDSTGTVGLGTSLALGNDGLPVISYYDSTNGDLKVAKCGNAACSSANVLAVVDPSSASAPSNYGTSIAVPADGLPIIAYKHEGSIGSPDGYQDLKVAKCGNPTCSSGNTITLVDTANSTGYGPSVAIGSDGLPVISYVNWSNADLKVVKCGNAACSSGNTITTVDAGTSLYRTSIAIGADGLPIIAYSFYISPEYELKVVKCGNAACSSGNTFTIIDTNGSTWYLAIAKGSDGLPVIAYIDWINDHLKIAKCGNAACSSGNTITTVDDTSTKRFPSITMASDGLPIISYGKNEKLQVAKCGNAACSSGNTITVIDITTNPNLGYTSIKVAPDNLPIISYYDSGAKDLKVAKCDTVNCAEAPSPSPSPSPAPAFLYLYHVSSDRRSYNVWAFLENENDPRIYTHPQAACKVTPPQPGYNYCGTF